MKINNNRILIDEINSIKSSITDNELFSSKQFYSYLSEALKVALKRKEIMREVRLVAFTKEDDDFTACTDGKSVYINTLGPLIRDLPDRYSKYSCIIGHIVHEVGHRLFTDFANWNKYFGAINTSKFYPELPKHVDAKDIQDKLSSNTYRSYVEFLEHQISNIFEDQYIENRLHSVFAGEFIKGLHLARNQIVDGEKSLGEMIEEIEKGESNFMTLSLNSMLFLASDGELNGEGLESNPIYLELVNVLNESEVYRNDLAWQSDTKARMKDVNEILCILAKYIPEADDSKDDEDGNDAEDEIKKTAEKIVKSSVEAKGHEEAISNDISDKDKETAETVKANSKENDDTSIKSELSKVFESIAEDSLESKQQDKRELEAKEILVKNNKGEERWQYILNRKEDIGYADKNEYLKIFSDVSVYANATKRLLSSALKQKKEEGKSKGYMMGRFDASSYIKQIYTHDGKSFSKNIEPDGKPDVVFGVLIDQSGSMYGKKIIEARKTAILLDDVLRNMDIPYIMAGHTVHDDDCTLFLYHDFVNYDHDEKYRLSAIDAISGNRDGAAISYMAERLKKRSEKRKILIVITDGIPAEIGFNFGVGSVEDARLTVNKYSKDIQIFGAVIDGEMDSMHKIYGNKVMDLCDLSKLPIQLTALVKHNILH